MIVQEILIFLTEMKFFKDKRFSNKVVIRERNKDKTCEEEQVLRIKERRIPKKAMSNKTTINANTSISPAWCCNCGMITCHVIVCIILRKT